MHNPTFNRHLQPRIRFLPSQRVKACNVSKEILLSKKINLQTLDVARTVQGERCYCINYGKHSAFNLLDL